LATGFQDIDWVSQGFILDLGSLDLEIGFSTVNGFFLDTSGYDLHFVRSLLEQLIFTLDIGWWFGYLDFKTSLKNLLTTKSVNQKYMLNQFNHRANVLIFKSSVIT
jgi:hypothetical protein